MDLSKPAHPLNLENSNFFLIDPFPNIYIKSKICITFAQKLCNPYLEVAQLLSKIFYKKVAQLLSRGCTASVQMLCKFHVNVR